MPEAPELPEQGTPTRSAIKLAGPDVGGLDRVSGIGVGDAQDLEGEGRLSWASGMKSLNCVDKVHILRRTTRGNTRLL